MLPRHRRHPADVLQHNLVEDTLPNVVGRADLRPCFLIGSAGEIVLRWFHGARPMQDHCGTAVGADDEAGILVQFLHLCGALPVLPDPLDDIPNLPRDQRRMGPLKHQTLLPGMLHIPLVLVGFGGELHVDRVAKVDFILQDIGDGAVGPVIGLGQIEAGMAGSQLAVGVDRRTKHLFGSQLFSDLARAAAGGAQGENAAHHSGGLLVHHQFALGILILSVTVGRSGAQPLPALRLGPLHRPDLPAGVPHEPLVKQVLEGHQVRALAVFRVHIVVDGDVADAELREPLLDVQPRVQLVSPQTAEILGDDDPDFPVLHVGHHALEIRPVETGPGVSVIHIELDVGKAVVPGVLL